ncbi:hypothetical protein [Evansella cellulosilytica]|uniref:Uncharacterized protein n=1 Tax=Evansella cellulosilytica (strain ATCC 21833 / DSM 2522 / FERM P-1141 / JCM 9156 / N-4) TaxID=649639 RepID=E6U1M7_EVAC2|nr:hypothetical protein [Evansella cellulosilytica]ADU30390.1 hypothetical protein Bcell_2129 [Evansella cellulosilytica DSM 2522]
MIKRGNYYMFEEPNKTRKDMAEVLVKGLGRSLTDLEARIIYWLGDCCPDTRGVLLDLFKEYNKEIETLNGELSDLEKKVRRGV